MRRLLRHTLLSLLLATLPAAVAWGASINLTAAATVLSNNNCRFFTAAATLDFGTLDPASPVDVSASASFRFRCLGPDPVASFLITRNDGLYAALPGQPRMRNASDAASFLPYALALSPVSGTVPRNVMQTLTVTGTLSGADYQFATAGSYSDLVILSINP